jgi:D-alanyl-lipoteichoic acid acyltransferase DltB (MBOAT superfamily)
VHAAINYLLPFHMLAAGPIQAYDEFVDSVRPPRLGRRASLVAIERITLGLFKKFVVAHLVASIFLTGFRADSAYTLLEIQVFYLWVYLDFSAYTDIAVGLGWLMGVATPENFDRPLSARNITVFWERWHISLSRFIRRNLFTPVQLGLVRRWPAVSPLLSASLAFSVAFLLCGLWHEISLRFMIWGGMHALGLIVCNLYRSALRARLGRQGVKRYMESWPIRWLATALTFEFVACSIAFALYPRTYWWE